MTKTIDLKGATLTPEVIEDAAKLISGRGLKPEPIAVLGKFEVSEYLSTDRIVWDTEETCEVRISGPKGPDPLHEPDFIDELKKI